MNKIMRYVLLGIFGVSLFIGLYLYKNGPYKFSNIDVSKYEALIKSKDAVLIYVTGNDCSVCNDTESIIKKVYKRSNIKINLLNVSLLSNEEKSTFVNAHTITSEKKAYSIPMFIYVKYGNIKDSIIGVFSEDEMVDFINKNNITEMR